jgi:excisionase family DNA binding protein
MAPRDLIDANEAAKLTGLAKPTIYKLAHERRLRSFRVLSALRFDRADVLALVKEAVSTASRTGERGK